MVKIAWEISEAMHERMKRAPDTGSQIGSGTSMQPGSRQHNTLPLDQGSSFPLCWKGK